MLRVVVSREDACREGRRGKHGVRIPSGGRQPIRSRGIQQPLRIRIRPRP